MAARCVALLRGINVGGKNPIRMTDLKAAFEGFGLKGVSTFIASGNVLFQAPAKTSPAKLIALLEAGLSKRFGYAARLVLRTGAEFARIVDERPVEFGAAPAKFRYDVIFLKEPLTAAAAIEKLTPKDGVDRVWPGPGVIYFSRLIARATQSRLSRVVSLPVYQSMTIRNWNTTRKLQELTSS